MDIRQTIGQPIMHQLLVCWLRNYKRPNEKINALTLAGLLSAVKRGFYIAGPKSNSGYPDENSGRLDQKSGSYVYSVV